MAKPVVDRLEKNLAGQAQVLRINVLSKTGLDLANRYGVRATPTTLVFDGRGTVVYTQAGIPKEAAITAAVQAAR